MFVSIVGYGKMGRLVEETAAQKGISVVSTIDPNGSARYSTIDKASVGRADVCVCFTQPASVLETIKELAALKKNIVMATTGWYERTDEAKATVDAAGVGMVYSPNFALGVNLFFMMVEACAAMVDRLDGYDVAVHEMHHRGKLDSPSGTAIHLGEIVVSKMRKKRDARTDLERSLGINGVHISSTRCGYVPGQHAVIFDSEVDTIELTHTARSRKGFAVGALVAADWIYGKKGFYTKEDVVRDLFNQRQM